MKKRSALRLLCHWSTRSCGVSRAITFSPSRPDHTLESTGLVHEVYLRLLGGQPVDLQNRAHFIAVASRLMRRIFVDYARQRRASKRDGGCRIAFEGLAAFPVTGDAERLAWTTHWTSCCVDERQEKTVEMKFFGDCRLQKYPKCSESRTPSSPATGPSPATGCIAR